MSQKKVTNEPVRRRVAFIGLSFILMELSGCASISSEYICSKEISSISKQCSESKKIAADDGIVYYMPKRPIRVNVSVVTDQKKITVTVVNNYVDETLPDTDNVFLLRYNKNLIGDNNMAIGINNNGLLSVTHADTINKINDIATNAAIDAATIAMGAGFVPENNSGSDSKRKALETISEIKGPTFQAPNFNSITYM